MRTYGSSQESTTPFRTRSSSSACHSKSLLRRSDDFPLKRTLRPLGSKSVIKSAAGRTTLMTGGIPTIPSPNADEAGSSMRTLSCDGGVRRLESHADGKCSYRSGEAEQHE